MLHVVVNYRANEVIGPFSLEEAQKYIQNIESEAAIMPLYFDSSKSFKYLLTKDNIYEMVNCIVDCNLYDNTEDLNEYVESFLKDWQNG